MNQYFQLCLSYSKMGVGSRSIPKFSKAMAALTIQNLIFTDFLKYEKPFHFIAEVSNTMILYNAMLLACAALLRLEGLRQSREALLRNCRQSLGDLSILNQGGLQPIPEKLEKNSRKTRCLFPALKATMDPQLLVQRVVAFNKSRKFPPISL